MYYLTRHFFRVAAPRHCRLHEAHNKVRWYCTACVREGPHAGDIAQPVYVKVYTGFIPRNLQILLFHRDSLIPAKLLCWRKMMSKEGSILLEQTTGGATYALAGAVVVLVVSWLIGVWKHQPEVLFSLIWRVIQTSLVILSLILHGSAI